MTKVQDMTTYHEDDHAPEIYTEPRELTGAELDAIKVLTGIRPYGEDEDDAAEGNYELMVFIYNAVQFAASPAFDRADREVMGDLDTYALYLLDAMHLLSKTSDAGLVVQVIAAMAVHLQVEMMTEGRPDAFPALWQKVHTDAQTLVAECVANVREA